MIAQRLLRGVTGTLLLGTAMLASAAPASAACKGHEHEGRAVGVFQTTTEIAARSNWRAEVRSHDGFSWSRWSLARDKTMRCSKLEPGRRWRCVARATPCDS